MMLRVGLIVFCAILYVATSDRGRKDKTDVSFSVYGTMGYGLELLLNKLEFLESKMQKVEDKLQQTWDMQLQLQKMGNEIHEHRSSQEQSQIEILAALQKVEKLYTALYKIDHNDGRVLQNPYCQPTFSSCKDVASTVSGTYLIRVKNDSVPFQVYCEQQAYGGGWIVIQYRYDGSLDFYRDWNEFRDGFGDMRMEFWLGLEKVHQLTKSRKHELIIELKEFSGKCFYAQYDAFKIGSEKEQYVLKKHGSFNETVDGDESMTYNRGMKFTKKDRENDVHGTLQCAHFHKGAWWYRDCTYVNLNGPYINTVHQQTMFWYPHTKKEQGLAFSRMMIRELE